MVFCGPSGTFWKFPPTGGGPNDGDARLGGAPNGGCWANCGFIVSNLFVQRKTLKN